jgi:F-type H+-transporting ATPase subunit epsilon
MADENIFGIELVTPERILLTGSASEVILRTAEGDVTFLAGHTPLVGTIEPGVLRVLRAGGDLERVATHGGFVQVEQGVRAEGDDPPGTRITLLVGVAELAEEIDVERARAALEAAEVRLAELTGAGGRGAGAVPAEGDEPDAEQLEAAAELRRAQVRLEAVDANAGTPAA